MLTSSQIRAGRAIVGWSARELAEAAKVGLSTIQRLESSTGVPGAHTGTLEAIQSALEKAGVVFLIGQVEHGPGVAERAGKAKR